MSIWFWFWVVLAAVLIVLEIFTAGFFMLPFGVGAGVAAAVAFFEPEAFVWQWAVFIVSSAMLLVVLRRFAQRITHEPPEKVGVDRVLGKTGTVIEELSSDPSRGRVRVGTEEWRARTPEDSTVPVDAKVIIERIEGTRLIVVPAEEAQAPSAEDRGGRS